MGGEQHRTSLGPLEQITFQLPFPPTANNLFLNKGKARIRAPHYDRWLAEADAVLRAQRVKSVRGSYRLEILAVRPDRRRRDIANLEKATSDFLQKAGVIEDDCLAQSIHLEWVIGAPVKGGSITVTVEPC